MLCVRDLRKRFGAVTAVHGVSLDVARGEIVALVGPNGAGKSTLIKTIVGFTRPTEGTVEVHGHSVVDDPVGARRLIGYVPQRVAFTDTSRTDDVIRYYASLHGLDAAAAATALDEVGLTHAANRPARALSGGMMQRLGLGIALLGNPPLLVLDEPTVSLDPDGSDVVRAVLAAHRARGGAVIIATHLLADAELLADRICLMRDGRVLACDTIDGLIARFTPDVARLTFSRPEPSRLETVYRAAVRHPEAA